VFSGRIAARSIAQAGVPAAEEPARATA